MNDPNIIRVCDINDVSKTNRVKYLFRIGKLKKYVDKQGYVCFRQDEYIKIKNEKRGKKTNDYKVIN